MQPMRCLFIAFFTLTLYFTGSVLAAVVTGTVTGVLDGGPMRSLRLDPQGKTLGDALMLMILSPAAARPPQEGN